jgi:hypothetical protein
VSSMLRASIYAGFVAGTVDVGAACLINHVPPGPVLRFIASALLGTPISHNAWVYCLGMVLQWAMSMLIAAVFVIASSRVPFLMQRPLIAGLGFGTAVYVVMTFVVLPLSRAKGGPISLQSVIENLLAMFLFGLIVSYMTHELRRNATSA